MPDTLGERIDRIGERLAAMRLTNDEAHRLIHFLIGFCPNGVEAGLNRIDETREPARTVRHA